ncbi:unnamed protein product [Closterium sp. NIES-64]|nr:unnamed protein product [Closterium sp. NIES-64]
MEERLRHAERLQAELEARLEGARGEKRRARERGKEVEMHMGAEVVAVRSQVERMERDLGGLAKRAAGARAGGGGEFIDGGGGGADEGGAGAAGNGGAVRGMGAAGRGAANARAAAHS